MMKSRFVEKMLMEGSLIIQYCSSFDFMSKIGA